MTRVLTAESMPPLGAGTQWGNPREREVRLRIQISVAAYAYEFADNPIMPDELFDWLAGRINKHLGTGHLILDEFFASKFSPMTGMWIHEHPELDGIRQVYDRYWKSVGAHIARQRWHRLLK